MSHAIAPGVPGIDRIPGAPTNNTAELVFSSPWEARAFALVVALFQQGHFSWEEWTDSLSARIRAAGDADREGRDYYLLWLAAAEELVARKGLCRTPEFLTRKAELEEAQGGPAADR
jgi:nitrile hydratase accessory protein